MGYSIAYSCQYTSSTQNATCNCALYSNTSGRYGDDKSHIAQNGVTLVPIGRIEGNGHQEVEREIRAEEVSVVQEENVFPVTINGKADLIK